MPAPYPGQEWKHGWIPVTAAAAKEKNHGKAPAKNSAISRMVAEAAAVHKRSQARESREAPATKQPAKAAGAKAKPGKKVGVDTRNTSLHEGDDVTITTGPDRGKTGKVKGKGRYGAVQVEVDGKTTDMSPANIRSNAGKEESAKVDDAIRAARRPAATSPQGASPVPDRARSAAGVDADVLKAYKDLAPKPGDWVRLARLRDKLSHLSRAEVDEALRRLNRGKGALIPEGNQKTLTSADRAAAINIGTQPQHLLMVER